jgi:hypothetical protein
LPKKDKDNDSRKKAAGAFFPPEQARKRDKINAFQFIIDNMRLVTRTVPDASLFLPVIPAIGIVEFIRKRIMGHKKTGLAFGKRRLGFG